MDLDLEIPAILLWSQMGTCFVFRSSHEKGLVRVERGFRARISSRPGLRCRGIKGLTAQGGQHTVDAFACIACTPPKCRALQSRVFSKAACDRLCLPFPWGSDTSLKDGLFHEFKKYGKVTSVQIHGASEERYGLVFFRQQEDQEKALNASKGKLFFGMQIEVTAWIGPGEQREVMGNSNTVVD